VICANGFGKRALPDVGSFHRSVRSSVLREEKFYEKVKKTLDKKEIVPLL
jgi:hypothetical protein